MTSPGLPPLISSDGHLEVRPERWTPRMPAKHREHAPRTIKLPDGGDALLVEGQPPYPAPFLDLRAGRTNETWEPFGVTVDDTAGGGPPEQGLEPRRRPERPRRSDGRGRSLLGGRGRREDAPARARRFRPPGPASVSAHVRVSGGRSGDPGEARAAKAGGVGGAAVPGNGAVHELRPAHPVRRVRSLSGAEDLYGRGPPGLGAGLERGWRLRG